MKIPLKKSAGKAVLLTFCYGSTILEAMIPDNKIKYGMYALIVGYAVFLSITEPEYMRIGKDYPVVLAGTGWILMITLFSQIISGPNPGTLIQPFFLFSCFKMGFHTARKNKEKGCIYVLKLFSVIIAFAALVGVPEYVMKQSLFFPDYGHAWGGFRIPSIYGHPIRLGTSLTIGLSIYIFLYQRSLRRCLLIGVSLFGIYACASRSSWLACAVTGLLTLFSVYRKKISRKIWIYGLASGILLAVFLMSAPGKDLLASIFLRFAEGTGSNVSRVQRLGAASYIWKEMISHGNPVTLLFGHGEDAAARAMLKTNIVVRNFSTTDNEYLLVMYNYGIIFLTLLLWGIVQCVKNYTNNFKTNSNLENCLYFICISQAICSFFYEITENKSCAFLIMFCIGMLMALKKSPLKSG